MILLEATMATDATFFAKFFWSRMIIPSHKSIGFDYSDFC